MVPGLALAGCPDYLDHSFTRLHSSDTFSLCEAAGSRAILLVNTASHCGFTPQFKDLETLHEQYGQNGLTIVGFPSNDFNQEAGSEQETAKICYVNNGVTFTMVSPLSVKGESAHPLFRYLAAQTEAPNWNFNKYLIDPANGSVTHFDSQAKPLGTEIDSAIKSLL